MEQNGLYLKHKQRREWRTTVNEKVRKYLAAIGGIGGKKSRRTLSPEQSRAMVKAREAKRPKKPETSVQRTNDQEKDKQ